MSERSPLPEPIYDDLPAGRVLLLAPHHDDDIIGAGGTVCRHVSRGDEVHVLIAFRGAAGDPDGRYDPAEYVALRQREARAGGRQLGLSRYEFWDYPEGHEPGAAELMVAARRLAQHVRALAPDIVYAPWIGDYHVDHYTLARVARLALVLADFEGQAWGYEVWSPLVPTRVVEISEVWERKVAALREHASQLDYQDLVHKTLWLTAHRSIYLRPESRHGEAFRPLGAPSPEDAALLAGER